MTIEKISLSEWKELHMENMFEDVFDGQRDYELETCDFVLLVRDKYFVPVGFITCHEMDSETLYWQFGGATKKIKRTLHVAGHYVQFLKWSLTHYKRVTTRIENTNSAMLKMALSCGFLIYGVWNFKNKIYLELCNESGG
ncbi:MAG: hypothetical protein ACAH59_07655 [Pseudobdellovibrionaceae bacterium]